MLMILRRMPSLQSACWMPDAHSGEGLLEEIAAYIREQVEV